MCQGALVQVPSDVLPVLLCKEALHQHIYPDVDIMMQDRSWIEVCQGALVQVPSDVLPVLFCKEAPHKHICPDIDIMMQDCSWIEVCQNAHNQDIFHVH